MVSLSLNQCYNTHHGLFHFINKPKELEFLKELSKDKNITLNHERQQLILQVLNQKRYSSYALHLKKICQNIAPSDLHLLLKATSQGNSQTKTRSSNTLGFQRLTKLLTIDQIEAAIRTEYPSFKSSIEKARDICESAKYYLDVAHPCTIKPFLRNLLSKILSTLDHVVNILLSACGVNGMKDLQKDGSTIQCHLHLLLTTFSSFSAWASLAIAISKNTVMGFLVTSAVLFISNIITSLYIKYLKPTPQTLDGWRNLTTEAITGRLPNVKGRQQYIDEIANTLIIGNSKPKVHPLLVGPTGAGKNEIIYGFAHAVAKGRYPALKGKQVFYINTAKLIREDDRDGLTLQAIQERLRGRNHKVILIFDKFHLACKKEKNNYLGERLQSLLNTGKDNFPHVVAIATSKKCGEYIDCNEDFTRLFKKITVKETTKMQTMAILKRNILEYPGLYATEEAIEAIYDLSKKHFPELPQPYISSKLLNEAVHQSRGSAASELQSQIDEKQSQLEMHLSSPLLDAGLGLFHSGDDNQNQTKAQFEQLKNELELLKKQMQEEVLYAKDVQRLIGKLEQEKQNLLHLSIKLAEKSFKKKKKEELAKEFALLIYRVQASQDALQSLLSLKGKHVARIDAPLITQLVEKMLKEEQGGL